MSDKSYRYDLEKCVFQVCVWMNDGSIAFNSKVSRAKLLDCIRQFSTGSIVVMEACATSHFWGCTFQLMGFLERLIPTQHVKALAPHQKNDANDALAICERHCAQVFISFLSKLLNSRISRPFEAHVS